MKIELEIDIESIVIAALTNKDNTEASCAPIKVSIPGQPELPFDEPVTVTEGTDTKEDESVEEESKFEYAPAPGRRFNKLKKAYHARELELDRRLTNAEKVEVETRLKLNEEAEKDAEQKVRTEVLAEEITAETANEEDDAEPVVEPRDEEITEEELTPKVQIAETASNSKIDSLFS